MDTRTEIDRARHRLTGRIEDLRFPMLRIDHLIESSPGVAKLSTRRRAAIAQRLLEIEDQIDRLCNELGAIAGDLGCELSA